MLDLLTEWLKKLILLVLLASFLDLLLPNSSMQRYAKMVLGLFIILTLLTPVFAIFGNQSLSEQLSLRYLDFNTLNYKGQSYQEILNNGEKMKKVQELEVLQILEEQIGSELERNLATTFGQDAEVNAFLQVNNKNEPEIEKIVVYLHGQVHKKDNKDNHNSPNSTIREVETVQIEVGTKNSVPVATEQQGVEHQEGLDPIQRYVQDSYQLSREQVMIYVRERNEQ